MRLCASCFHGCDSIGGRILIDSIDLACIHSPLTHGGRPPPRGLLGLGGDGTTAPEFCNSVIYGCIENLLNPTGALQSVSLSRWVCVLFWYTSKQLLLPGTLKLPSLPGLESPFLLQAEITTGPAELLLGVWELLLACFCPCTGEKERGRGVKWLSAGA